jgi:hypothetical protein
MALATIFVFPFPSDPQQRAKGSTDHDETTGVEGVTPSHADIF